MTKNMVIQTNITGVHTMHENIKIRGSVSKTVEKLSSGFRINRAADDVAGLSVSESMRAQITELARAQRNVQEGIDVSNTADGALAEINSMLIRARELCIEGANGIYTQPELDAISDELNEIFDDIDRITAGTRHNDIPLFRYEGSTLGTRYDYNDFYTKLPSDKLIVWGEMDFIQSTNFDPPNAATKATVTFQLDDSIDLNDASTLSGKSITINGYTFNFDKGDGSGGNEYTYPNGTTIRVNAGETVQTALNRLKNYNCFSDPNYGLNNPSTSYRLPLDSITVNNDGSVTLTAPPITLVESMTVDGKNVTTTSPDGNGSYANTLTVTSAEGKSIMQVDGNGIKNNSITYGTTATYTRQLPDSLTADQITNLNANTFIVCDLSIPLKDLNFSTSDTRDSIGAKLVNAINSKNGNVTAQYQNGKLELTAKNLSSTSPSNASLYENTKYTETRPAEDGPKFTTNTLGFTVNTTQSASPEHAEIKTVTITSQKVPFSFNSNGYVYVFYDSAQTNGKFPPTGFDASPSYAKYINTNGLSSDEITQLVSSNINVSGAKKTVNGNVITFESGSINKPLPSPVGSSSINVTSKKPAEGNYSSAILFPSYTSYFQQEASVSFDLGNDISKLVGKGFGYTSDQYNNSIKRIEFVNGAGTGIQSGYDDVDISSCNSLEDVRAAVEKAMGSNYKVTLNGTKMIITGSRDARTTAAYVTDGYHDTDGIFTSQGDKTLSQNFSGGTDSNHSQAVLDFSSINDSNLETLLGKGFRINCATCTGEYINVFFCWENNGEAPESFQVTDPATGQVRTIHNIAVELSKVSNGEKIVEDIVKQVSPQLNHFTGVKVGNPPTQLIAYEKRVGDAAAIGGVGSIETGVYTNFEYSYEKVEINDTPPAVGDGGLAVDFRKMLIYVGSEPDHQWIPIHLPWLDLPTLGLQPPEAVDLGGGDDPFAWLERVDAANGVIITSRTRIGADYNRLEHTYNTLTQARENMEDSESRIRDADMAKLMVQYMKDQIIGQAQQSMMLHSNERPQQILELLR